MRKQSLTKLITTGTISVFIVLASYPMLVWHEYQMEQNIMLRMENIVGKEHEMAMNTLYERIIYWGADEGLITATIPEKYLPFYDDRFSPWSWTGLDYHFFRITEIDLDSLPLTDEVTEILGSLKYLRNITVTEMSISEDMEKRLNNRNVWITTREGFPQPEEASSIYY